MTRSGPDPSRHRARANRSPNTEQLTDQNAARIVSAQFGRVWS